MNILNCQSLFFSWLINLTIHIHLCYVQVLGKTLEQKQREQKNELKLMDQSLRFNFFFVFLSNTVLHLTVPIMQLHCVSLQDFSCLNPCLWQATDSILIYRPFFSVKLQTEICQILLCKIIIMTMTYVIVISFFRSAS